MIEQGFLVPSALGLVPLLVPEVMIIKTLGPEGRNSYAFEPDPPATLWGRYYSPHLLVWEMEAGRGGASGSRLHSYY